MPTRSISLPGREAKISEDNLNQFLDVEVVQATVVDPQTRGSATENRVTITDAEADDVVEIIFDNGTRQWWSVAQLQAEVQAAGKGGLRSAVQPTTTADLEIPSLWLKESSTRGIGELAGKLGASVVKLLRPKLEDIIAGKGPELAAKAIAETLEKKIERQLNPAGEGLYRYTDSRSLSDKLGAKDLSNKAPYLLFLHGTASSSVGSFGQLGVRHGFDVIGIDTTPEWEDLQRQYPDRIVAYEHRTLSKNPVQNAIEVASLLPGGATLHMISHSRGGLVGELLCLSQVPELGSASQMKRIEWPFANFQRDEDIKQLRQLVQLLADKKFKIERFVRVACPARGTKLLSKNINDFFSGIFNLMENLPWMKASPTLDFVRSTVVALLKYPTDAQKLPGIEAMMPESPLVAMLNNLGLTTQADLAVIQGDIQPGDLLDKLKFLPVEMLFREDNDLVVNTRSMSGGLRRTNAIKFFDQGQEVNHFSYFTNHKTRTRLTNWLKSGTADLAAAQKAGFEALVPEPAPAPLGRGTRAAATPNTLPVVFVVPGMMGSHLSVKADRIWLDTVSLALGGLNKLRIDAPNVVSEVLVASAYQNLIRFLQDRHEVLPFPYDWRRSLREAAAKLSEAVKGELANHNRPIRFVAHSMGGLVVRTLIARHPDVWEALKLRDCRLLMLGTPNRGSYVVPQILAGQEKLLRLLATVDLKNDKQQLIEIIRRYDGLLEMLPEELLDEPKWVGLKGIRPPDGAALIAAKALRRELTAAVDKERMFYVAGTAASTPFQLEAAGDAVKFRGTPEGDGRVTYELGKLDGVRTWFVNAEHGDLAAHHNAFNAYAEVLERGTTDRLSAAPITRRGAAVTVGHEIPEAEIQMFPDETDLVAAALGGQVAVSKDIELHTLNLRVVHTHLYNARFPIAVGHYKGDQIVGAEGVINRLLSNRLAQLSQLGLYPGDEGTAEIVRVKGAEFAGAMVVGLGEFGTVNRDKVRKGITAATLRFALSLLNDGEKQDGGGPLDASFSSLLLGTYSDSAFNPLDSVSAVVEGALQTNRILQQQNLWQKVRINTVEFIELYEDMATLAVRAAHRLTERPPLELNENEKLALDPPYLESREGGQPQRPLDLYDKGWSRKIRIAVDDEPNAENQEKQLSFTVYSERARNESLKLPTQPALVEGLIKRAIDAREYKQNLGTTLFELLVPNSFKDQLSGEGDLVLYVDSVSAQYPWELLAERTRDEVTPVVIGKSGNGHGLIRQLATGNYRPNPQMARGGNVLIVGDPDLTGEKLFKQLPGARQEATSVLKVFDEARGGQFTTYPQIFRNALSIISALFEHDYRIIHLAGHGMYDAKSPLQSGMILGNGMRLTAAEIGQMRIVPDLVFINCCYLGNIDVKPETNKLAASISLKLIEMGVRAVVAAGWEVDDDAAKTFAEVFYQSLLGRMRFGDAVKRARTQTYREHSQSNTWGAYQCYGDPDFVLDLPLEGKTTTNRPTRFFSPREYRDELRRVPEQVKRADSEYLKSLRTQLEGIYESLPNGWQDAEMLAILGDAWSSLGDFEASRQFYSRARTDERANLTVKQLQDHANLLSRYANQLHQQNAILNTSSHTPGALLEESLELLKTLQQLNPTAERSALFGSLYKQLALVSGNVTVNLRQAAKYYKQSNETALQKNGELDLYPALNWLTLEVLLATLAKPRTKTTKRARAAVTEVSQELNKVLKVAQGLQKDDDLWKRLHLPDAMLLSHLLQGNLSKSVRALITAYREAIVEKADAKALDSVTGQLEFLAEMLKRGPGTHAADIQALLEIKNALENKS